MFPWKLLRRDLQSLILNCNLLTFNMRNCQKKCLLKSITSTLNSVYSLPVTKRENVLPCPRAWTGFPAHWFPLRCWNQGQDFSQSEHRTRQTRGQECTVISNLKLHKGCTQSQLLLYSHYACSCPANYVEAPLPLVSKLPMLITSVRGRSRTICSRKYTRNHH